MQFNSYPFIFLFLPATVGIFWLLLRHFGRGHATGWLLFMSVIFYACVSLKGLAIVVPSILLDYRIARCMSQQNCKDRARRALLFCGIFLNVIFLGYFKYRNFFLDIANSEFGTHFLLTSLFFPVGISFLVFQKIAFLIDVASGELKTVTLFFPRTIAGPIIRYQEVVPQFSVISLGNARGHVALGLCLFSIGLFKKAVLADTVGQFVPSVFDVSSQVLSTESPGLLGSWVALLAYTFQLYFDFSGYSDMALGVARMVGVQLPINFNSPFKATSIVEFWSRWHITLTRFLTAYIYTPIVLHLTRARMAKGKPVVCGRRTRLPALVSLVAFPTLVTMTISGLWHGAGWQFVAWGALHGAYLTVNQSWRLWRRRPSRDELRYERIKKQLYHVLTFLSVVFALVLFRSNSIATAGTVLVNVLGFNGIFPHFLELVERAGVPIPWAVWPILLPWSALGWISVLFVVVMWLPNSQEYVSRLESALERTNVDEITDSIVAGRTISFLVRVRSSSFVAPITAVMCALGVMAIDRGGGFIYGGF